MADGPAGVRRGGWPGLSLKYADRPSSRPALAPLPPILPLLLFFPPFPPSSLAFSTMRAGTRLYRVGGARNCRRIVPLPLVFFYHGQIFNSRPRVPDFSISRVHGDKCAGGRNSLGYAYDMEAGVFSFFFFCSNVRLVPRRRRKSKKSRVLFGEPAVSQGSRPPLSSHDRHHQPPRHGDVRIRH